MNKQASCQVCGNPGSERLQTQAGFRILRPSGELPFDIHTVLCDRCGLVYTDPQPAPGLLADFYAAQERDAFVEGDETRIPGEGSRRSQATWIREAVGSLKGLRVLEIGCYDGYLLHLLEQQGAQGVGIEPSASAAALGQDRYGVTIHAGLFEEIELQDGEFDLIVLSHVLEHLAAPAPTLARCHELLKANGQLFIEVPNVLKPRVESAVNFFTFDHLFNFCPDTLGMLFRAQGFEPGQLADDFEFPAFRLMGRKRADKERSVPASPETVARCRDAVRSYVEARAGFVDHLRERIDKELAGWLENRRRIAIYGAGYHTECLLDATPLAKADLVALVDGNPSKQGREVFGLPVVSPRDLSELKPDVVVISSYDFQTEMIEALARVGLGELPVVAFYPEVQAFSTASH